MLRDCANGTIDAASNVGTGIAIGAGVGAALVVGSRIVRGGANALDNFRSARVANTPTPMIGPAGNPGAIPGRPALFRGTTDGFPGGQGQQAAGVTPTSTNPATATIFAVRGNQFGDAVVLLDGSGARVADPNISIVRGESEVPLDVLPLEFAEQASLSIPVNEALDILTQVGVSVPRSITNNASFAESLRSVPEMTPFQVDEFIRLAVLRSS